MNKDQILTGKTFVKTSGTESLISTITKVNLRLRYMYSDNN